jgi:hypothetical protein
MAAPADRPRFVHRIDADGRISFVNDDWLAFAADNGYRTSRANELGRLLESVIGDDETRHIYALLIERARACDQPVRFDYRCDAPDRRRWMQMSMRHLAASDEIEFASELWREEPRPPVALIRPPQAPVSSNRLLSMCSWCKSVLAERAWVEIEQAVIALGLFGVEAAPRISHGICPDCKHRLLLPENAR